MYSETVPTLDRRQGEPSIRRPLRPVPGEKTLAMSRALIGLLAASLVCAGPASAGPGDAFKVGADVVASGKTPTLQDVEALENVLAGLWERMPLTQRHVVFVGTKADLYGGYMERASNVFARYESLVTYVEPVGYVWKSLGNGSYGFGITLDFKVKTPDGKILAGQDNFQSFDYKSHYRNRELFMNLIMTLSGIQPGNYVLGYTLHDKYSDKVSTFEQPFVIRD